MVRGSRTPSDTHELRFAPTDDGGRSSRHGAWIVIAMLLVLLGVLSSILAANASAHQNAARSHRSFATSALGIAATLKLSLQHETDLVLSAQAFILDNPQDSEAQFVQWASTLGALRRYPELRGFGESRIIPRSELQFFAAHPIIEAGATAAPFRVIPSGTRPFYCFTVLGLSRDEKESLPPGFDFCAGTQGKHLLKSRDSGRNTLGPVTVGRITTLSLAVPTYRNGLVPTSVVARRAAFVGWIGMSLVPKVLLRTALVGHPDSQVALRYGGPASKVIFRSGLAPRASQVATIDLHDGWTVVVNGSVANGGLFSDADSMALLLGGIAVTVLLGAFIYVLGTGRSRSMMLVDERTNELRFQALHDPLTGLPNRALIMDRIDQLLVRNRRNATTGAALYIDIDDFKNVNDSLGHEAGDQLLVAVAARMASTLRDADTIGRMGGDEFVVLIDGDSSNAPPALVAQRLLDVMVQPFTLHQSSIPLVVNASVGIALGDRITGSELLRDADIALYLAKAGGKNRYELFQPKMHSELDRRIGLEFELRSALTGDQFRLVYQPIYNLDDLSVVGVEALLRWESPTKGPIQPDEFIPILEQTGQIRAVGSWVLRHACEQMAAWQARGHTLDMSVNISARQLDDDSLVENIRHALESSGLGAGSLIIEVTETALMDNIAAAIGRLRAVKDLGVRIAVDDFGTGYSSLGYLRQFPVDCLKIDKSFTNAIDSSPESKALVRTFVRLGQDLGLKTLAEGVETAEQMDFLRADHVNEVQGFLLARPQDPETFESQFLEPMRAASRATPLSLE